MEVIVVHGGAGFWPEDRLEKGLKGVKRAAEEGFSALLKGKSALDAVELAVMCMEDDPVFNAGVGSALTLSGEVEAEASVMDGSTLSAGAVALVKSVKNPVRLARLIMERTDHVFLLGRLAEELAREWGLEEADLKTPERIEMWEKGLEKLRAEQITYLKKLPRLLEEHPWLMGETVGAIALDREGRLAAATSTGGLMLKLPGRIGDTPQIGAGTYADRWGACSGTGIGEVAVKLGLARMACIFMRVGLGAREAAQACMGLVIQEFPWAPMGVITLDRRGQIGAAHTSERMCWAYMRTGMEEPFASDRGVFVHEARSGQ